VVPYRRALLSDAEFGLSPFTEMDTDEFVRLVAANPSLLAVLRTQLEYTVLHLDQMNGVDQLAAALLDQLRNAGVDE
jgi:hypothetical protein